MSTVTPFIPEEEIGTDEWTDEGLRSQAIEDLATRVAGLEETAGVMWLIIEAQQILIKILAEYLGFPTDGEEEVDHGTLPYIPGEDATEADRAREESQFVPDGND